MRVGIILHSHTGNTLSVGERLKELLFAGGHIVNLERVVAENEDPNSKDAVKLISAPDISIYDYVIIGAPVHAFSLSRVMKAYLAHIPEINNKKVTCFVTEHFPKPWMGGNRAIKQMIRPIELKGGKVTDKGVVNWSGKTREEQINDLLTRLCRV